MHCFGMPSKDIEELQEISKQYNLFIVEDAAESLEVSIREYILVIFLILEFLALMGTK